MSYDGALYQATKDTAQAPGGEDWICVARAGRDGCDGSTPRLCGTFDAHEAYARLDVVEYDGASFVAIHDNPGIPGDDGWQLLSRPGRRGDTGKSGPRGEKGDKGERGVPPPTIVNWTIGRLTPCIIALCRRCRMARADR